MWICNHKNNNQNTTINLEKIVSIYKSENMGAFQIQFGFGEDNAWAWEFPDPTERDKTYNKIMALLKVKEV